ncbi:MAG TPA: DUF6318 family protein [Mycobacteriales bacterium]
MIDVPGRLSAVLLVGMLGLLAGCGASDPSATADEAVPPAATPTAVVASAAPELPAAVRSSGESGAQAATRYWFAALSYAQQSGDPRPVVTASTTDCRACTELLASIRSAFAGGGSVVGGWYTVRQLTDEEYSDAVPLLSVVFDRDALSIVGTGGATMQTVPALPFQTARVRLQFDHRWRVAEVEGLSPLGSGG